MVDNVTKRDGSKEEFIPEKLVVSAIKAGADRETAWKIESDIEGDIDDGVKTEELREMILERLENHDPEWKENWQVFDRAVKKR